MAALQQLYAVSIAMAVVVVLLWQGSLVWLATGALFLGVLIVAAFLVLSRRAGQRNADPFNRD